MYKIIKRFTYQFKHVRWNFKRNNNSFVSYKNRPYVKQDIFRNDLIYTTVKIEDTFEYLKNLKTIGTDVINVKLLTVLIKCEIL